MKMLVKKINFHGQIALTSFIIQFWLPEKYSLIVNLKPHDIKQAYVLIYLDNVSFHEIYVWIPS